MKYDFEIVPLRNDQVEGASEILAEAFFADPLFGYVLPDDSHRLRALPSMMAVCVRYGLLYGEAYTTSGEASGTAVWIPPESGEWTEDRLARAGVAEMNEAFGEAAMARFNVFLEATEVRHREDAPDPHWYLALLGVDPVRQRQGIGSALVRRVTDRVDARCYLETMTPEDVRFYRRLGFEVKSEADLPGGPRFWTMLREPRAPNGR
jgi:ribosomal protein S18 acetylase RimI-like enzyme